MSIKSAAPRARLLRRGLATLLLSVVFAIAMMPTPASAKPSQSDVFKSIQDNVGDSDGSVAQAVPWICAGAGVIALIAFFSRKKPRQNSVRPLNNPHRLAKEMMKAVPLRPRELKQLKVVAEETPVAEGKDPINPLVLLLCPSMLEKTLHDNTTRADPATLAQILNKLASY